MMSGFKNQSLNESYRDSFFNLILDMLIKGCEFMVDSCNSKGETLPNHEERLRSILLESYLDNDNIHNQIGIKIPFRFIPEAYENYSEDDNTYIGRVDMKVVSGNWLSNKNDYYIVECKRIDGTKSLNQKYVLEGVHRFVEENPKYSSYNNKNIMLGFVVNNIDICSTVSKIDDIHKNEISGSIKKDITLIKKSGEYCIYESFYVNQLCLKHIFYNISSVIS